MSRLTDFTAVRQLAGETVRVRNRTEVDAYNQPTYGDWVGPLPAFWDQKERVVRDVQGEEIIAKSTVYVFSTAAGVAPPAMTTDWQLELPDAALAQRLLRLTTYRDEDGLVQVVEVHVG